MPHNIEKALPITIEERHNNLFEFVIERYGILGVVIACDQAAMTGANRPARHPLDAAFQPPAIKDTQRGYAVQRRFHATGTGGLQRWLWRVEPDVDTRR